MAAEMEERASAARDTANEAKARRGNAIRENSLDDMLRLTSVIEYVALVNADPDAYPSGSPERMAAIMHCDDMAKFILSGSIPHKYKEKKEDTGVRSRAYFQAYSR